MNNHSLASSAPLSEAQAFVDNNKDHGTTCPCCNQFVKRYKRKITSAMAYALLLIHKESAGKWIHVTRFLTEHNIAASRDVVLLRHWQLLQKSEDGKEDGNPDSGDYKITREGILFSEKMIEVPKFCFLFNNEVNGFSEERTDVIDCLGDSFNYSELMPKAFFNPTEQMELL